MNDGAATGARPESIERLVEALGQLDEEEALASVRAALDEGCDPNEVLGAARIAMQDVGVRFDAGEVFLPELVAAGELMTTIADSLRPHMTDADRGAARGDIVIGTVQGDIHDIGKNLVAGLLEAAGYRVHDLGVDVPAERFAAEVVRTGASAVALSCLLTVGFESMRHTVAAVRAAAHNGVRIMVGGAPVDDSVAAYVGADSWGADAVAAVGVANTWLAGDRDDD